MSKKENSYKYFAHLLVDTKIYSMALTLHKKLLMALITRATNNPF